MPLSNVDFLSEALRPKLMDQAIGISTFGHLFNEYFQYCQRQASSFEMCEKMLTDLGRRVGPKVFSMCVLWQKSLLQDKTSPTTNVFNKAENVLKFIREDVWKFLFNRQADDLQKLIQVQNEYYLIEKTPIIDYYVSFPKDYQGVQPSLFLAGIIESIFACCGHKKVTVETYRAGNTDPQPTYFHVKIGSE